MDLWIWSEETGALVKVESLDAVPGLTSNNWVIVIGNASGEIPIACYATEDTARAAIKKIAMELNSINKHHDVKVLAVMKTGHIASLLETI